MALSARTEVLPVFTILTYPHARRKFENHYGAFQAIPYSPHKVILKISTRSALAFHVRSGPTQLLKLEGYDATTSVITPTLLYAARSGSNIFVGSGHKSNDSRLYLEQCETPDSHEKRQQIGRVGSKFKSLRTMFYTVVLI